MQAHLTQAEVVLLVTWVAWLAGGNHRHHFQKMLSASSFSSSPSLLYWSHPCYFDWQGLHHQGELVSWVRALHLEVVANCFSFLVRCHYCYSVKEISQYMMSKLLPYHNLVDIYETQTLIICQNWNILHDHQLMFNRWHATFCLLLCHTWLCTLTNKTHHYFIFVQHTIFIIIVAYLQFCFYQFLMWSLFSVVQQASPIINFLSVGWSKPWTFELNKWICKNYFPDKY